MKIKCKNCGAEFDENLSACPYCGEMNQSGAEKEYMDKLEGVRQDMGELADDSEEEVGRSIRSVSRVIIISAIIFIVIALSIVGLSYYLDNRSMEANGTPKERLAWQNQYYPVLEDLYEKGDFDAIMEFRDAHCNDTGFSYYEWPKYDILYTYEMGYLLEKGYERMDPNNEYDVTSAIYYVLNYKYSLDKMRTKLSERDLELIEAYEEVCDSMIHDKLGMDDEEFERVRQETDEGYGPVYSLIKKYVKKNYKKK
ncbi:MAG: hypothetical protein K6G69_07560 [Lachnospiraceae bacterium]|nr:hypothetical protein [Lachnospiraceae bacterium]